MPGESGFDLAQSIRASFDRADPDADRARRDREPHRRAWSSAPTTMSPKPFEPRELSLRIANILKRAQPRRRAAGGIGALRAVRLSSRRAASWQGRGGRAPHRPRARHAARAGRAPGETVPRHGAGRRRRRRSTNARSTCRSTGCGARSSAIRPIRCSCRPCAASATGWWCRHDQPRHRHRALRSAAMPRRRDGWDRARRLAQRRDAEGPLRPLAADHHRADGDPAVGRRLRVHGAALEHGDAAALGGGGRRTSRR